MATYLLTWNPKKSPLDPAEYKRQIKRRGYAEDQWSCGRTRRIKKGDRLYFVHLGKEPRGIFASGTAASDVDQGAHWDESKKGKTTNYVEVRWDTALDPKTDKILDTNALFGGALDKVHWTPQGSGVAVPDDAASELARLWNAHVASLGAQTAGTITPAATYLLTWNPKKMHEHDFWEYVDQGGGYWICGNKKAGPRRSVLLAEAGSRATRYSRIRRDPIGAQSTRRRYKAHRKD